MILRVSASMAESSRLPRRVVFSRPRNRLPGRVDVVGQGERLVDGLDVVRLRIARVADRHGLAVDEDLAGVGRMGSRQHAHQRRLAGTVAADEADDLARVQVDGHLAHGVDATECDVDVAHLDERRCAPRRSRVSPSLPLRNRVGG